MTFPHGIDLTTDWHCHLLPGLDDGPATLDESLEMARLLAVAGVRIVHCTPHYIKGSYEYTPDEVRQAVALLQEELNKHKIKLELRAGMEYLLDEFFHEQLGNPLPLGDTDLLLVETYPALPLAHLKEHLFTMIRAGFRPLLAHPERNSLLAPVQSKHKGPLSRLLRTESNGSPVPAIDDLRAMGCLFQGNLGSAKGFYGKQVESVARTFMHAEIYTHWGSDCHSEKQCRTLL